MLKKFTWMLPLFAVAALIGGWLANEHYRADEAVNRKVNSVVGSSLFMIWNHYEAVAAASTEPLTPDRIAEQLRRLSAIEAYSHMVDQASGHPQLRPIAKQMILLAEYVERHLTKEQPAGETQKAVYAALIHDIETLMPIINHVYYVPGSPEGGEAAPQPADDARLAALYDALVQRVSALSD